MQKKSMIVTNMKNIGLLVLVFLMSPAFIQAETVLRTGSDISVEADQIVKGDYYVSVGPVGKTVMSGKVVGDMYAAGASVIVNGEIGSDLAVFAGSSQIHASVTDDVRIVAGEVTIAEDVGGDVFVIASSLSILSTAHIAGDVFFFGGTLSLEGDVDGSLFGKAQSVNIDSRVGKDIDMTASASMVLGDSAVVDGSVRYTSFATLTRGQGAIISGSVQKTEYASVTSREQARSALIPIFITLFATLSLYLLAKKKLELIVVSVENSFARNFLIGGGVLLLGPIAAILLMVTVLGLFVGMMTFAVVMLLYVLGIALSSVVFGAFVAKIFTKKLKVSLLSILVGTIALQALLLIPVAGPLTLFVVFAVTVGAITGRMYQSIS